MSRLFGLSTCFQSLVGSNSAHASAYLGNACRIRVKVLGGISISTITACNSSSPPNMSSVSVRMSARDHEHRQLQRTLPAQAVNEFSSTSCDTLRMSLLHPFFSCLSFSHTCHALHHSLSAIAIMEDLLAAFGYTHLTPIHERCDAAEPPPDNESAATRRLRVPELLHSILLFVGHDYCTSDDDAAADHTCKSGMRHLLDCMRVCKQFKNAIDSSIHLQRALFFLPDPAYSKPRINSLFANKRIFNQLWLSLEDGNQHIQPRTGSDPIRLDGAKLDRDCVLLHVKANAGRVAERAQPNQGTRYAGASWRRMYLSQPPRDIVWTMLDYRDDCEMLGQGANIARGANFLEMLDHDRSLEIEAELGSACGRGKGNRYRYWWHVEMTESEYRRLGDCLWPYWGCLSR